MDTKSFARIAVFVGIYALYCVTNLDGGKILLLVYYVYTYLHTYINGQFHHFLLQSRRIHYQKKNSANFDYFLTLVYYYSIYFLIKSEHSKE